MQPHRHQQGFSLVELLMVVAIIGIIAAIAVPNLLSSRRAANEASALQSMRVIGGAEAIYLTRTSGNYGTADELRAAELIDESLHLATTGTPKNGYAFSVTPRAVGGRDAAGYISTCSPTGDKVGANQYTSDESGVIYSQAGVGAPPTSTGGVPIGN